MKLHGSIIDNLNSAIASAQRLSGRPVYTDTLAYWNDLLEEARRVRQDPSCTRPERLSESIIKFEEVLSGRAP